MKCNILQTLTTILTLGGLIATSPLVTAESHNFCSKTTKAAYKACQNDAKDDLWETRGICINVSDKAERRECFNSAKQEKKESLKLCYEQIQARNEVCALIGEDRYDPLIEPQGFVDPLDIGHSVEANAYMPLIPGLTRIYQAGDETVTVTVTNETIEIMGVTCIVVRDTVTKNDELVEDTIDWYAQDIDGNVWYFGEIAKNYKDGLLSNLDGSWMAGENGAKAGIIMKAYPQVGDVYRQEWALAEAEDMGEVLSISETESSPAANCINDCLQTRDFTPLEPEVNENKFYAPGIGAIVVFDVNDPEDREELIEYHF